MHEQHRKGVGRPAVFRTGQDLTLLSHHLPLGRRTSAMTIPHTRGAVDARIACPVLAPPTASIPHCGGGPRVPALPVPFFSGVSLGGTTGLGPHEALRDDSASLRGRSLCDRRFLPSCPAGQAVTGAVSVDQPIDNGHDDQGEGGGDE